MTIGDLLRQSKAQLQTVSPTPALDAQVLLMHALGLNRSALIMQEHRVLNPSECEQTIALVNERCDGRPIAHLTGQREFWSLEFRVSPEVLIPRPDTELLVEQALKHLKPGNTIVDLGTGSGVVAIAIAHERPDAQVYATDISDGALGVARRNAQELGTPTIRFIKSHWFEALTQLTFDVIVSNPPYIDKDDPHLNEGDVRFDPDLALVANEAGLADLNTIIDNATDYLNTSGKLLVEHGYLQGRAVRERFVLRGFTHVMTVRDCSDNERVTVGIAT